MATPTPTPMTTSIYGMTSLEIPCCLCGTLITANAANQCSTCLAQEYNLQERLQRGPGGAEHIIIYQCRQCRRYQRNPKTFELIEPESPELLSICLKHIPALSSHSDSIKLIEAGWVWTEPHSMRFKLKLTVRTEIQNVQIQQRVIVEMHCRFKQCPDCNREFTNRTWQAVVQLRQRRTDDAPKKGLAALEMVLAKNHDIRKDVLSIETIKDGFDFYFLSLVHAQRFSGYLQRAAPMRAKISKKLVSADWTNNTANIKSCLMCDIVPFCRDDLILIDKRVKGKLAGRLAVVTKVSSVIHLMDASPKRENLADSQMELSPDAYYKYEKLYTVLQAAHRAVRFVVLDVELCNESSQGGSGSGGTTAATSTEPPLYQGPNQGPSSTAAVHKHALADVQVARESDFGSNDETFNCVTHLGNLIRPGDVVLGYDLTATVGGDWEMEESFHNSFVLPDVVLVKKIAGAGGSSEAEQTSVNRKSEPVKGRMTKKKERRRRRYEGKKSKELEESAVRMGFLGGDNNDRDKTADFDRELENDPELAEEVAALEKTFGSLGTMDEEIAPESEALPDSNESPPEEESPSEEEK
jgi:nonsense-mediated mRNA decay protein 3